MSEDPIRQAAGDMNIYRYVFNGPTNGRDPDGKSIGFIQDLYQAYYDGVEAAADAFLRSNGRDPIGDIIKGFAQGFRNSLLWSLGFSLGAEVVSVGLKGIGRLVDGYFEDILRRPLGLGESARHHSLLPRSGKQNAPNAVDHELQDVYRNLWRPQDVYPGGTIGILLREIQAGGPLKHLPKAKQRLTQLIKRVNDRARPLSQADRQGAERVINDLKDAIRLAEGK